MTTTIAGKTHPAPVDNRERASVIRRPTTGGFRFEAAKGDAHDGLEGRRSSVDRAQGSHPAQGEPGSRGDEPRPQEVLRAEVRPERDRALPARPPGDEEAEAVGRALSAPQRADVGLGG